MTEEEITQLIEDIIRLAVERGGPDGLAAVASALVYMSRKIYKMPAEKLLKVVEDGLNLKLASDS